MIEAKALVDLDVLQFTVPFAGREVQARITRETLEKHFEASTDPSSWLRSYREHRARIHRAVENLVQAGVREPVTLRASHF